MRELLSLTIDVLIDIKDCFKEQITNKPFISVLFPASGLGASYIPDGLLDASVRVSPVLSFIDNATPYLRFIFLILTLLLTILSVVLQIKKLKNTK